MRSAECGISRTVSLGERPFTSIPHSTFRIPQLGWGERCDEVFRDHRFSDPRSGGGRHPSGGRGGCRRDRRRPRIGNAALSPAARWSVVDRSRRAARGCRPVDVGVGGRAGGSRGAGRTQPRDRGGERQEHALGWRRHGARADARAGGTDRGSGRAAGGCGGRSRGRRGDEKGERAARAAAGDGPDGPRRRRAGGRKRCLARDPREPGTLGLTGPYGPGIVRGCHRPGFLGRAGMKTFSLRKEDVTHRWFVVDAAGQPLGRLASRVAQILRGKHKPTFTPHLNSGDCVVVVNAARVKLTGRKLEQKRYFRHTGYMGHERFAPLKNVLEKRPERVIEKAVWGMLPKTTLSRQKVKQMLKVYAGPEHPHAAQQPEPLSLAEAR